MRQIEVKPLTLENFKKYGSFSNMENPNGVGGGIPGMTPIPADHYNEQEDSENEE